MGCEDAGGEGGRVRGGGEGVGGAEVAELGVWEFCKFSECVPFFFFLLARVWLTMVLCTVFPGSDEGTSIQED